MERHSPYHLPHKTMDRRSFLKLSGLLSLGAASATILPAKAEAVKFNKDTFKISDTKAVMGTYVSMTLFHSSRDKAQEAMGRAYEEIARLTGLMNRFDSRTVLAQLNHEGYLDDIPAEMSAVISEALHYHRITSGAFDISVKPIIDLFQESFANGKDTPPDRAELNKAIRLVGAEKIELGDRIIRFKEPGMGITLDGIAKGFIVDRASEVLARYQVKDHLINAGGDIRTMGSNPDKKSWTVAIEDPEKKRHYPDVIHMTEGAIATSGNYEVYFDREKMFHHIVNPKTGMSPQLDKSVSVMADSALKADALSTSVFVMKPSDGTRLMETLPNCSCFIVSKNGKTIKSSKWNVSAI